MKKKKNLKRKKNIGLPSLKKDIKDFLLSEEGKISKKKLAKMGIALSALALTMDPKDANALTPPPGTHVSGTFPAGRGGHDSHTSHASHSSHTSHGSHGDGGWC